VTRNKPVYILQSRATSAAGKPQALKMKNIPWHSGIECILYIKIQGNREVGLRLLLVMKYAVKLR
jgi:hypothetical protein